MMGERGASRWTVGALVAVVIGVVVSLAVAQGWFDGDADTPESGLATTTQPAAESSTSSSPGTNPASTAPVTSTTLQAAAVGDHPLCRMHEERVAAIQDHLPVESPDDLETFITAQIKFHQDALDVVDAPDRSGFTGMLDWYEELAALYEPLGWESPPLEDLVENPPPSPSTEAVEAVSLTLEELCGVIEQGDQPAP